MPLEETVQALADVLRDRPEVQLAYLYGSRVQGEGSAGSDLDVGIVLGSDGEGSLGLREHADLARELEDAIGAEPGTVDLRVLDDTSPRFLFQVLRDGVPILARDEEDRVAFETEALRRYYDFQPLRREQGEAQRERFRDRARGQAG